MKTTKKLCAAVLAIMLAVLFALTAFSFVGLTFKPGTKTASADAPLQATNVNLPSEVTFGDTVTVTANATGALPTVKAPNGTTVVLSASNSFVADQLGLYSVTYSMGDGQAPYTLYTYVTLEEDYFLKVDDNGAGIPTYIAKDGKFTLPAAGVYYYDENQILRAYPDADDVTITVTDSLGQTLTVGNEVTTANNGKYYIYYSAKVGNKYYSQTFTVNVQTGFVDNEIPSLNVTSVTSSGSVNRAVSIPVATVSDDFDENVKVTVTVLDPEGNNVKTVDIDENGYAYHEDGKTYDDVKFDNDKVMSFYPLVDGQYVVRYVAEDDAGKQSGVQSFNISVSDKAAPVLSEIDDYMIPATWGMNINDGEDSTKYESVMAMGGKVTFPVPTYIDNLTASENIKIYFRITDSDRSRTVLEFRNINTTEGDDCKFTPTASSVYGETTETFTFNKDNLFTFDLAKYNRPSADDSTVIDNNKAGTYTVLYRAEDANGNTSSKSYEIVINDTFTDIDAPTSIDLDLPSYISVTEETFTVPTPSVADKDSVDSRLHVQYRIYSGEAYIDVKGGEVLNIVTENDNGTTKHFFELDNKPDVRLQLPSNGSVSFQVVATDDCGNSINNTTNLDDISVKIVDAAAASSSFTATMTGINATLGETSVKQSIGGFKVDTSLDMRYYTGFEVNVYEQDVDGNWYNLATTLTTLSTIDKANNRATIYVNDITFTPGRAGNHTVVIRVFDVSGNSSIYSTSFNVDQGSSGGADSQSAAVAIPTTGSINTKYTLKNETMSNIGVAGNTYYVVRKIVGSSYSLMGSELTARTQGLYYFNDGYVEASHVSDSLTFNDPNVTEYSLGYQIDVTDSVAPVIEVQGFMPAFADKGSLVSLPSIVGISPNGNVKITVSVKDKNSHTVITKLDDTTNRYSFTPTLDGEYVVTVTATINNATPVTSTYNISVGDVVGPVFTLSSTDNQRLTVGSTFKFASMTLDTSESATGVTIRKSILDPSKSTVDSATVSGSYTTYRDYEDNGTDITFDRSGTYTIVYEATDSAGNTTTLKTTVTVSASGSSVNTSMTTISIVLIVLAVVLLAGVIVYVFRFRKVKR